MSHSIMPTTPSSPACTLLHNGVAASSSSKVLVCVPSPSLSKHQSINDKDSVETSSSSCEIIYASHAMLNVARHTYSTLHLPTSTTRSGGGGHDDDDKAGMSTPVDESIWNVYQSLRTSTTGSSTIVTNTTSAAASATKRVITSVARLRRRTTTSESASTTLNPIILSAFSDGTFTSWYRSGNNDNGQNQQRAAGDEVSWVENLLLSDESAGAGATATGGEIKSLIGRSITDIDGCTLDDNGERIVIVACTSAGASIFEFQRSSENNTSSSKLITQHSLITVPANSIRLHPIGSDKTIGVADGSGGQWLILVGTAAPRHNKIHVFLLDFKKHSADSEKGSSFSKPLYCGPLTGHEDWITCFDWFSSVASNSNVDMLASGSQDSRIRLWKFATMAISNSTAATMLQPDSDTPAPLQVEQDTEGDDDDDDENDANHVEEEEEEEGESRLEIVHSNSQHVTSVTLEALLIGHEEPVTAVRWHPSPRQSYKQDLILISSSMDRTIFIWGEHDENGVWTPISRVGSAGGILGGSIGSSLLGFINTIVEPVHGQWILGHAYGGALHFFSCDEQELRLVEESEEVAASMNIEERASLISWRAKPCLTGHFAGITDLSWEAEAGDYLLTVSNDQTCRLWASISSKPMSGRQENWVEIARPQVHGYNLSAVTSISTIENPHLMVSGADEKEVRAFDATKSFLSQSRLLFPASGKTKGSPTVDGNERVDRAYIPSLGLTTKASAADGADEDAGGHSQSSTHLPLERDLGAVSLWPEVRKLYGHNTELTRLCSTISARTAQETFESSPFVGDLFVASSAKARTVDDASVRVWNVKESRCIQVLSGGHKSTVAALAFSPDGKYLASSGKDRRLCIWRRSPAEQEASELFFLAAAMDTSHKRIVWGVNFCPYAPSVLASGARDGLVKIWKVEDTVVEGKMECTLKEVFAFSPTSKTPANKPESVTSVSFAPLKCGTRAILALGLENGLIELWSIPLGDDMLQGDGVRPEPFLCFSPHLCHIATVTKLAWRPCRGTSQNDKRLVLASCSMDHACRIFEIMVESSS